MKPITGKIIAGERVEQTVRNETFTSHRLTIESFNLNPVITLGTDVTVNSEVTFSEPTLEALRTLRAYLKDRPALMDDFEVHQGINALNIILRNVS